MAKAKGPKKKFYIQGKDEVLEKDAPLVSGEFQIADAPEGELAQGQTVEVRADAKFSDDLGTGDAVIIRTFEFLANPETFKQFEMYNGRLPTQQELFVAHQQGIEAMLWSDGLTPAPEVNPQVLISKQHNSYVILVGAKPMAGTLIENTQTLSEIFNGRHQQSKNEV